jgi:hypothetical protein
MTKKSGVEQDKEIKKIASRDKNTVFELINPDAGGIDIGSEEHWVAVPEGRDEHVVRKFGCFTVDLHDMAIWLKQCGVKTVAMESTGVYWICPFQILESHGIAVKLVNARQARNVPGRKTDVSDCQWLQRLHTYGLLSGSFRPEDQVCVLRSYWRHRDNLVRYASAHIQHMQKAITATAHKLARIFYVLWSTKQRYEDVGAEYYERQYRERVIRNLKKKAHDLGYTITLQDVGVS